ncbi:MAG: protein-disulfide reductase DsbD domain-containing protein [Pseudomonadota bacterium]
MAFTALALICGHAIASEWTDVDGAKVRLIVETPLAAANGAMPAQIRGAIQIDLAPGWHTYWLEPGPSGIPPQISLTADSGVEGAEIAFPKPTWVDNQYGDYAGYSEPVDLPVTFTLRDRESPVLSGQVFLGVCEAICIPVIIPLDMALKPGTRSTPEDILVAGAFSAIPRSPGPGEGFVLEAQPDGGFLVTVEHSPLADATPRQLFAAMPGSQLGRPQVEVQSNTRTVFRVAVYSGTASAAPVTLVFDAVGDAFQANATPEG